MVVIRIDTVGEERFVRGFNSYVNFMKDFRPVFEKIAEWFWDEEEKIFQKQGNPEPFRKLSDVYAAWKQKYYRGKPIMQLRGRLIASLTGRNQADAQDTVKKIDKTEAEFGTRVPYAHRHQMGTFGMPKRKIVQLTEARKRTIGRMIHQWAYEQLKEGAGLQGGLFE